MHPIATGLLAAGLFGASFTAVMFFSPSSRDGASDTPVGALKDDQSKSVSKCEDIATVNTLKQLALKKIKEGVSSEYLLNSVDYQERSFILIEAISGSVEFTLSGFRDRGKIGEQGSVCAALISVRAINRKQSAEMSTEYSVEPTSDGKMMVSARFMPN